MPADCRSGRSPSRSASPPARSSATRRAAWKRSIASWRCNGERSGDLASGRRRPSAAGRVPGRPRAGGLATAAGWPSARPCYSWCLEWRAPGSAWPRGRTHEGQARRDAHGDPGSAGQSFVRQSGGRGAGTAVGSVDLREGSLEVIATLKRRKGIGLILNDTKRATTSVGCCCPAPSPRNCDPTARCRSLSAWRPGSVAGRRRVGLLHAPRSALGRVQRGQRCGPACARPRRSPPGALRHPTHGGDPDARGWRAPGDGEHRARTSQPCVHRGRLRQGPRLPLWRRRPISAHACRSNTCATTKAA